MSDTAIIFCGGDDVPAGAGESLPADALVIAADSGLDLAVKMGAEVDVLVGDLDSVGSTALAQARRRGIAIIRHPVDKDASDLELAVDLARERGVSSVIVIGGSGGRIDHFLANASLLAAQDGIAVEWRTAVGTVYRVNRSLRIHGSPGDTVSLLALGGAARGVHTLGLHWMLEGEDLPSGSTRGISNRFTAEWAEITVASGNLLVIV